MDIAELERFIVAAKLASYVGDGEHGDSSRLGSRDLLFERGIWLYRDSYFGGADFIGQEIVWFGLQPVWAMNYCGYIVRDDLIDADRAGATVKAALSAMYAEERFLGGFVWDGPHGRYADRSTGDVTRFTGRETIAVSGTRAYALDYAGGLIRS